MAVVGDTGAVVVGIEHGGVGGLDGLEHIGVRRCIMGLVEMTVEAERRTQTRDGIARQGVAIRTSIVALEHVLEESAFVGHLHISTDI